MEAPPDNLDFLLTDANLRNAVQAQDQANKRAHRSSRGDSRHSHSAYSSGAHSSQNVGPQPQQIAVTSKRRLVRLNSGESSTKHKTKAEGKRRREAGLSSVNARLASSNMTMLTALDAGRLDPFDVYPQAKLPKYLQALIDHTFNHVMNAYLASDRRQEAERTRSLIIGEIMADPLMWYPIMMSGITHYAFVHEQAQPDRSLTENHAGKIHRMLRLSYKSQTIALIRAALEREKGVPSDATLLAISTLMSHGSSHNDDLVFTRRADPIQMRKGFGTATDMHYYSAMTFDLQHWHSILRFITKVRGGIHGIRWPVMQQTVQLIDTTIAWRSLQAPSLGLVAPTSYIVVMASHRPDEIANMQMRNLLSGLPIAWRTSPERPHADLYLCLQHIRTLLVRYNQYQRRLTITQANLRPDLRLIIYTRTLVMHDLLELPILTTNGQGAHGTYELIRHSSLAFMQLVLFPVASVNELPRKILEQMHPIIKLCCKVQSEKSREATPTESYKHNYTGATLAAAAAAAAAVAPPITTPLRENSVDVSGSLVLWSWMLAGMLAFEHLQSQKDSAWVDALAPMVDEFAIRPEKGSWAMVRGVMETFMWLSSECDGPGQRWWNYACLWVDAKRREGVERQVEEAAVAAGTRY